MKNRGPLIDSISLRRVHTLLRNAPPSPDQAAPSRHHDFSRMSLLAQQHGAINLGQGFPDFDPERALIEAVAQAQAMRDGHNQYPPMPGLPLLRARLSEQLQAGHGWRYDPAREVTITAGGTQALFTALQCALKAGDEALLIEPAYDSYGPAIRLAGATPVGVPMTEDYRIDWPAIAAATTPRTRVLVLNTPHNPSGRVASADDLRQLADWAEGHAPWPDRVLRRIPGHRRGFRALGAGLPAALQQPQRLQRARRAGHADAGHPGRQQTLRPHRRCAG